MTSTKEQRRRRVETIRVNFAIEKSYLDAEDLIWQERYIEGTASLEEFLHHAHTFAEARRLREKAVDYARASVRLEGFRPTKGAEALACRMINGEINIAEYVQLMPDVDLHDD